MYKTKITIHGNVQAVGLRVQIKVIADRLGVCGTVENLSDGSVLIVCEAERADVEEMVRQIRSGAKMAVIKDVLVEDGPPATGMAGFEIVRGDSAQEMLSAVTTGAYAMVGALTILDEMKQGQARLEKGQAQTNETLARMEKGQARLEKGQAQTNETLARMEKGQARLEKGQAQTNETLARMEKGQARLEKGQAQTNETLARMEKGQARLEKGQAQTNETLARMEKGQEELKQGQAQTNETLARMEKGQEELKQGQAQTNSAIKSMDGKLDASLENDARSLEILRDLRDGGLLRVP